MATPGVFKNLSKTHDAHSAHGSLAQNERNLAKTSVASTGYEVGRKNEAIPASKIARRAIRAELKKWVSPAFFAESAVCHEIAAKRFFRVFGEETAHGFCLRSHLWPMLAGLRLRLS